MVAGFLKSEEGVREYKKIGLTYPDHIQDELYEDWLKQTQGYSKEVSQYYGRRKEKEVHVITRVRTKEDDGNNNNKKEYLTYQFMHYRLDPAANMTHRYKSEVGTYPIPIPHYKFSQMNFGKMEKTVDEVVSIEKGYSIPFTKKNLEKIYDIGLQHEGKVQYLLQLHNDLSSHVKSYEDFRDGVFEELAHFNRIPTEAQRQRWMTEGGATLDKQMQDDFIRQKTEGDMPKRSVTTDEVKQMIKHEQQQQREQSQESESAAVPISSKKKNKK
jgi:hypothetical protein